MAQQRFDIGSKWLLQNQGKGALLVGGFTDVRRIEPMPGEIVQNRKYPDGLLRVFFGREQKPHYVYRADLLSVSQVLGGLKYPFPLLEEFFGGSQTMFESPVLQRWVAQRFHEAILDLLKDRFDTVPQKVTKPLRAILDEKRLRRLIVLAAKCPDLETFHEALLS